MSRKSVKGKSSHVEQIQYDEQNQTLTIQFSNGSVYEYLAVPEFIGDGIKTAESKGIYLAEYIKGKFKHQRIK